MYLIFRVLIEANSRIYNVKINTVSHVLESLWKIKNLEIERMKIKTRSNIYTDISDFFVNYLSVSLNTQNTRNLYAKNSVKIT